MFLRLRFSASGEIRGSELAAARAPGNPPHPTVRHQWISTGSSQESRGFHVEGLNRRIRVSGHVYATCIGEL